MEALLIARQNGLNIIQMPIEGVDEPKENGLAGDTAWIVATQELKELLRFFINRLKGKYKR